VCVCGSSGCGGRPVCGCCQIYPLKMQGLCSFETWGNSHIATQCYISEDLNPLEVIEFIGLQYTSDDAG
jgi:hypothetical protein